MKVDDLVTDEMNAKLELFIMIKAIFFDIDGTLVSFKTRQIPDSTVQAIKQIRDNGTKVFIATGRHFSSITNLGEAEFDGYITMNGCYCLTSPGNVILKHSPVRRSFIDYPQEVRDFPACLLRDRLSLNYVDEEAEYLLL